METEDATPIVEAKTFVAGSQGQLASSSAVSTPTDDTSSPISPLSPPPSTSTLKPGPIAIPAKSPASPETDMSASYHEIFDAQMPPGSFKESKNDEDEEAEAAAIQDRLSPLLCCDNNTESTTEYLTSKLVEDSLKWQRECGGNTTASPLNSPAKKRLINTLEVKPIVKTKVDILDPAAVEDVERHARYLAACVDNMVENLSGVLQSISALTVDTLETYRDGVCKTCDEVDSNIKAMYQMMAKVEEINKSMAPAYKIGDQVKEIKRLLDLYENTANASTSK